MLHELSAIDFISRLGAGAILGVAIGFERQWRQRAVSLQTTGLVATGATLFALLSPVLGAANETRVLANIVTGVGFLAGGVILREGANIKGLNTAATIWATAAVGALTGVGLFEEALMGAVAIILINMLLQPVVIRMERRVAARREEPAEYRLTIECEGDAEAQVRLAVVRELSKSPLMLESLAATPGDAGRIEVLADLFQSRQEDALVEQLSQAAAEVPGVTSTSWKLLSRN